MVRQERGRNASAPAAAPIPAEGATNFPPSPSLAQWGQMAKPMPIPAPSPTPTPIRPFRRRRDPSTTRTRRTSFMAIDCSAAFKRTTRVDASARTKLPRTSDATVCTCTCWPGASRCTDSQPAAEAHELTITAAVMTRTTALPDKRCCRRCTMGRQFTTWYD